jgi:hypothetical protein
MKDLGVANFILGMEIKRDRANKKLWLNQRKRVEMILQRFNMHGSKASAVGILMYAMVSNKSDIAHAVGFLSRYMSKPGKEHWTIVKRVFRYLCGTTSYGLCYQGRPGLDRVVDIHGFVDADWVGDLDRRRSTSGYVFNVFGGAISWMSKRQAVVALSTTEAEYMESHSCKQGSSMVTKIVFRYWVGTTSSDIRL